MSQHDEERAMERLHDRSAVSGKPMASRSEPLSVPHKLSAAQTAWACFGQWLEICSYQAGGDISGADLTQWAEWFGAHMDPADAVVHYRCATEGHEFGYEADEDPDDGPARCAHCGDEDPTWVGLL